MKRILIVDDEKNIRLTMVRSLGTESYKIDQAVSAEEALEKLVLFPYDLLLLDIRLPGISGLEMLQQMQELDIHVNTIMISAHGTIETAIHCLKAGAKDFVEKPFSPDEIRQIVAKYA